MKKLLKIYLFSILKGRKEMKKFGALGIVICMVALCPQVASAVFYTYSDVELSDMDILWSNPDGNELLYYDVILGTGEYFVSFTEFTDGFAQVGIGAEEYYLPDMSGYEGIQLMFNNSSYSPMFANLFVQTYEADEGGYNNFYDNTWTELAVGETITLNLDFSAANHYIGGTFEGVEAVGSLDTIFKWGFQIGSNNSVAHGTVNPAAPVPEPATILLLGTGLLGIVALGRKRFIKKI